MWLWHKLFSLVTKYIILYYENKKEKQDAIISNTLNKKYEYGFVTNIEQDTIPPGLNEEVIKTISNKKNEPKWLLDWRLKAYNRWKKMKEPNWAELNIPKIDYDSISYFFITQKKEI